MLETQPATRLTLGPDPEVDGRSLYEVRLEASDGREYRPRQIVQKDGSLLLSGVPLGPGTGHLVQSTPWGLDRSLFRFRQAPTQSQREVDIRPGMPNVCALSGAVEVDEER